MFPDLRSFVDRLRHDRDLVEITAPVDAALEAAEIHRRVIAAGGPALLFTNVTGRGVSAGDQSLRHGATRRARLRHASARIDQAHRPSRRDVAAAVASQAVGRARRGTRNCRRSAPSAPAPARFSMSMTSDVQLDRLPVVTCWPEDGGPFITLPLVYTTIPIGRDTTSACIACRSTTHARPACIGRSARAAGFTTRAPKPKDRRCRSRSFLAVRRHSSFRPIAPLAGERARADARVADRRRPRCRKSASPIIRIRWSRSAEFALMGEVAPNRRHPEGPFGDHYGYYSLRHDYPVFDVRQIAHRRDAIYPATVVGKPRQEDFFIGDLLQELLSPLFPLVMPAVERLWSYGETGYHSLAGAIVKQRYKREAMASAFRILGEGQLSLTKFVLLTDRLVDLKDFRATLEHVLARTNPQTDLYVFSNLSMDTLGLHRTGRERRIEGCLAGPGRSGSRLAANVSLRRRRRRRMSPTCACFVAAVSSPARGRLPKILRRRLVSPGIRPSPAGRSSCSATSPSARPGASPISCGRRSRDSSRPPTFTRPISASFAITSPTSRPSSSTRA